MSDDDVGSSDPGTRAAARFPGEVHRPALNAAVLARIFLERARLTGGEEPALGPALTLAGARPLWDPARAAELVAQAAGQRFNLDLLLRAMLWSPASAPPRVSWQKALRSKQAGALFGVLEAGPRSHPTELVARHAAEVLLLAPEGVQDAARWFDLAAAVTAEVTSGSLAQFGTFTRRLRDGRGPDVSAPPGSIENPTFEYR